ncbi:uncharacterized protein C9orf50 homolog [Microtus oregoni]|uniref:uncharacterized protein C9orf50 homolog n=1 Tax=Microtus oregoni TaxID=111838 RepID=UPI001BB1877D|nr:uncharacterized protein C9orf50 homolog [Microtus oregoni]
MFWRRPAAGTPAYEPKRYSEGAAPRRSTPLLPRLPTPDVCTGRGSAGAWWQDSGHLPYLSPGVPYGPRGRGTLRALLLPPLLQSGMARGAGTRVTSQPAARDDPNAVGALLGEFLPTKFRDFLHQLRAKCAEPEEHLPAAPSSPQYPKGASEHCVGFRRPSCSFLPYLRPSGEGSRPRRRYCPFRVRFADETLQDTALRYWERNRAVRQNIFPCEQTTLPAVSVSKRVLGSVGRWLDSLPRALRPRVQDSMAGSAYWNCPRVSAQEPQLYLSEDATMSSRLPFISRATTPRPRGGLRTFLDTPNTVEQESFLPSLVLQSILKRGRPKGYRLLLPSTNRQQAQR